MEGIAIILAVLAFLGAGVALLFTSQATLGVAIMAGACLFAIFARMAQASHHHRELVKALDAQTRTLSTVQQPPPVLLPAPDTWLCFRCGQNVNGKHDVCSACGLARPGS